MHLRDKEYLMRFPKMSTLLNLMADCFLFLHDKLRITKILNIDRSNFKFDILTNLYFKAFLKLVFLMSKH